MKAVIMAGGEGSRLRPLTFDRPKPLVPVCNRPIMAYILDLLDEHRFQEVFVTLGYMPDAIRQAFGDRHGSLRIHYVVEEAPLGTAGGVAQLRDRLDSTFLVISGDGLCDFNLTRLIGEHRRTGALATLALTRVEAPLEYGVVLTDRKGRIRRFLEKPSWGEVFSDTVNTGVYVLEPEVLRGVPGGRTYDFSQHLFPALLRADAPLYGQVADGYWCDVGDPKAYLQANLDMLTGRMRHRPPGREAVPGVWTSGEVPEGILVDGPALIGEGASLEPGVRLEGGVVVGPGAVVGREALLRRSILWAGVRVDREATLVGALVCQGATVGMTAGVYEGSVVGADCRIGPGSILSPGVRLWPGTDVGGGARVEYTLVQSPNWSGRLLHRGGMKGRLGADLLPENALRIGMAFAATLPPDRPVAIGADTGAAPELLKQTLLCGLLAAGRTVMDVGVTASPITEFAILQRGAGGGIHVRSDGEQARVVFYDEKGRPLGKGQQRKLEHAWQRQDFPRALPAGAGVAERFQEAESLYLEHLAQKVDVGLIRSAGMVVQLSGPCWPVLADWLERLRCGPSGGAGRRIVQVALDPLEATWRLPGLRPEAMLALQIQLNLMYGVPSTEAVTIPVTAPRALEESLQQSGRLPVRVRQSEWCPGDPLLGIARMLEWFARERLSDDDLKVRLPAAHVTVRSVPCPWEAKGRVMRWLLEAHHDSGVEMVDGLRIPLEGERWVLILPDPDEPLYHVHAEGTAADDAERIAARYVAWVEELLAQPT